MLARIHLVFATSTTVVDGSPARVKYDRCLNGKDNRSITTRALVRTSIAQRAFFCRSRELFTRGNWRSTSPAGISQRLVLLDAPLACAMTSGRSRQPGVWELLRMRRWIGCRVAFSLECGLREIQIKIDETALPHELAILGWHTVVHPCVAVRIGTGIVTIQRLRVPRFARGLQPLKASGAI
jgi:hypothetical protein